MKTVFRSRTAPPERVRKIIDGPSMTKGSFKTQCDINVIMSRYKKTGLIQHVREAGGFNNLPDAFDYHQAMNTIARSKQAFDALPAELRDRFSNEPARLLSFLNDPENRDEAVSLGLVPRPEKVLEPPPAPSGAPAGDQPPKPK